MTYHVSSPTVPAPSSRSWFRSDRKEAYAIVRLAAPIVLIAWVNMAMTITDTVMVNYMLGTTALAAMSIGSDLYSILLYLGLGVLGGIAPLLTRSLAGEGSPAAVIWTAGWIVASFTAIVFAPALWWAPGLLQTAGIDTVLLEEGRGYSRALALTLLPMMAVMLFRTVLTAAERPAVFLKVTAFMVPLNALTNYVLIQGWGPFPTLGLTGAGVATFIVSLATAAFLALSATRHRLVPGWALSVPKPEIRVILGLGIPMGIAALAELGVYLGATLYAGRFGAAEVAAHTVTLRIAAIAYAIPMALLQAAVVRTSRAAAEGRDTSLVAGTAVLVGVLAGLGLMVLVAASSPFVGALVFDETDIGIRSMALVPTMLVALSVVLFLQGPCHAAGGVLRGLKEAKAPMRALVIGYWPIAVPVALILSELSLGFQAVWPVMAVGAALACLITLNALRRMLRLRSAKTT